MTKPFLSIVTISFNQAQFLRQCIDSVVSQKGSDVEYIVVDPGSTDGSREILQSYGNAIDHLVLEPDKGPADGLNKGFARATGEIGYFINSDDFLLPGAIGRMRRLWQQNTQADLLLGGAWMLNGNGEPIREVYPATTTLPGLLSGATNMVQHGMSFRLSLFHDAGGFNIQNRTSWDYELLCDMMARTPRIAYTDDRFGVFRLHDTSLSGGGHGAAHDQRYLGDIARIRERFSATTQSQRPILLQRLMSDPVWLLKAATDRMAPKRRRRRLEADLKSTEAVQ